MFFQGFGDCLVDYMVDGLERRGAASAERQHVSFV